MMCLQSLPHHQHIAERMLDAVNLLVVFVAFTRDQHGVALLRMADGTLNGGRALYYDFVVFLMHAADNFCDYFARIFAARIVRSNDAKIRKFLCDLTHHRAFSPIAIAAAAEYTQHFSACCLADFTQCLQYFFQRVRGVRVVHNHRRLLRTTQALHASGDWLHLTQ